MKRILITGATGFVGHHFIEHYLKNTDWEVVGMGRLDYSSKSGFDKIRDINGLSNNRLTMFTYDLNCSIGEGLIKEIGKIDYIIHLAAGSHVDNSIIEPKLFILNNIQSTINILEYARKINKLEKIIYFSTDEVFGTAPDGIFYKEGDRFNPGNPYSASKASCECICSSYSNTYGVPIIIMNSMNIIGERQHPEKFLPKVLNCVLNNKIVPIHSNKEKTMAGKRHYIHARNIANATQFILENTNETLDCNDASLGRFNIVGEKEVDNLEFAKMIARAAKGELKYEMIDFHTSRPGHDLRYALSGEKILQYGWKPPKTLEQTVENVVRWSMEEKNKKWLNY